MPEREPITQTMKASQVRQQFSQVLNRVFRGDTRVVVEKSGVPVAAIISARDLERFSRLEAGRKEQFKILEESWRAFEDVPLEEIEREVAKAVAEARKRLRQEAKDGAAAA